MAARKNRRHDWIALKSAYVQGTDSLRDMADKYNISLGDLGNRSAREGWAEEREKFRNELRAETERQTVEKASSSISDERAQGIRIIDAVLAKGAEQLIGKRDENGNIVTSPTMKLRARDLLEAVKLKLVLLGEVIERNETTLRGDADAPLVIELQAVDYRNGIDVLKPSSE